VLVWDRCHGYVRRADNLVSSALWIVDRGTRPTTHFVVWRHSSPKWIANQVTEAYGWGQAPRYLIRDRTGPMAGSSSADFDPWPFATGRHRRVPHGKTHMLKG